MGPVAEAGSPAPGPDLCAHMPHVTSRRRSGTGASEGKGGEKLFLSLLFCSLGVLNIRRGGSSGAQGTAGRGSVGGRGWGWPGCVGGA